MSTRRAVALVTTSVVVVLLAACVWTFGWTDVIRVGAPLALPVVVLWVIVVAALRRRERRS